MSKSPIFQEITTPFQYIVHTILEYDFHNLIHRCRNLTEIQEHTAFALLNLHRLLAGKVESLLHLLVSERQKEALILQVQDMNEETIALLGCNTPIIGRRSFSEHYFATYFEIAKRVADSSVY